MIASGAGPGLAWGQASQEAAVPVSPAPASVRAAVTVAPLAGLISARAQPAVPGRVGRDRSRMMITVTVRLPESLSHSDSESDRHG